MFRSSIQRMSICVAALAPGAAIAQPTPTPPRPLFPADESPPPPAPTPPAPTPAPAPTEAPTTAPSPAVPATPPAEPAAGEEENLLAHVNDDDGKATDTTQTFGKELRFFGIETNWSGYGDLVFTAVPREKESTFDASHFNPVLSVRMTDTLSGELELEVEHGGAEINIEYAMIDWAPYGSRALVVRAGKFLVPIGRYNEQLHPSFRWAQIERPLMMNEVVPVEWSDVGIQVRGQVRTRDLSVDYAAYAINGLNEHPGAEEEAADEEAGEGGFIRGLRSNLTDSNFDKGLGGRLAVTSRGGAENEVSLGVSGYTGRASPTGDSAGAERLTIIDVDIHARQGPLVINAELAQALFGSETVGYFHAFERGAYLQLALGFGKTTVAARYDYAVFADQMDGVVGEQEDFHAGALTVKYAPAPSWSVRAEVVQPFAPSAETEETRISTALVFVF